MRKYAAGTRTVIFGHAGHSVFETTSTLFIDVPGTYSAVSEGGGNKFRVEVIFAAEEHTTLELRMFDPANPALQPTWTVQFTAGLAPINWWNSQISDMVTSSMDPWQRQSTLQIRSIEGRPVRLGAVSLQIVERTQ